MKNLIFAAILVFISTVGVSAQTTAFIYQGRLNDSTVPQPTNGMYDFQFSLFDAGNNQIGSTITATGVQVVHGVFTVQLDFGSTPFTAGADRYLQTAVKHPADPSYITLTPRQQLISAPYSVQSLNTANLGGIAASQYVQTSDSRLSDNRNPLPNSNNYIQNSTVGQTANFKITGNGTVFGTVLANVIDTPGQYRLNGLRVLDADGGNNLYVGLNSTVNTGNNNSFVGVSAGNSNTSGGGNTFVGSIAGFNNLSGNNNSFFGHFAGDGNKVGHDNSFFGKSAGESNTASANSFFGKDAGKVNTVGSSNSFFGAFAGANNIDGGNNAFFGWSAGSSTTTGDNNTFIGEGAGVSNVAGSNNTLIGNDANVPLNLTLNFATAIGAGSLVIDNNTIALGRPGGTDTVLAYGRLQVNTLGSAGSTSLCRNASNQISTCSSSLRYKTNIAPFYPGLNFVKRLQPIAFDWKEDGKPDLGLGAEDVSKISSLLVTYNANGEVEGVKYDRIGVVLLNAVKEQQAQIEAQSKQIEELKAIVCSIKPDAAVCTSKK